MQERAQDLDLDMRVGGVKIDFQAQPMSYAVFQNHYAAMTPFIGGGLNNKLISAALAAIGISLQELENVVAAVDEVAPGLWGELKTVLKELRLGEIVKKVIKLFDTIFSKAFVKAMGKRGLAKKAKDMVKKIGARLLPWVGWALLALCVASALIKC